MISLNIREPHEPVDSVSNRHDLRDDRVVPEKFSNQLIRHEIFALFVSVSEYRNLPETL